MNKYTIKVFFFSLFLVMGGGVWALMEGAGTRGKEGKGVIQTRAGVLNPIQIGWVQGFVSIKL